MFPRLCDCITAIILSTLVYAVTVTEAQDESSAVLTSPVLQRRKSNYLSFAGKTYYFGTLFQASFFQAQLYCRQQGMQLVSINSQAENDRLGKFAQELGNPEATYWTSGTKLGDKNKWAWLSTGNNMVYFNWERGEPNGIGPNGMGEHCLEARYDRALFPWNDLTCDEPRNFICETAESCSK